MLWQLNSPFLLYINMKTATISNFTLIMSYKLCISWVHFIIFDKALQFSAINHYGKMSLFYLKKNLENLLHLNDL